MLDHPSSEMSPEERLQAMKNQYKFIFMKFLMIIMGAKHLQKSL